jgi:glycosyltransferase involved in cell wall biosynthesis
MSPKRIRVLQVIPDLGIGGAEKMLMNLVTHLDPVRHDVRVLSLFAARGTSVEDDLVKAGIQPIHLQKRLGFDGRMFLRVGAVLNSFNPDIVHTHRGVLQYALPALVWKRTCLAVHTVHNLAEREVPMVHRFAHRLAFKCGVSAVAIGSAVAASFEKIYGHPAFAIIPHGIPVARFAVTSEGRRSWRACEGIPDDAIVFVCSARLSRQKNVAGLLSAFAHVRSPGRKVTLLVAGEGPLRSELEAQVRSLGLAERVRLLGARTDVPEVLNAADVFVLSSSWEGNPLSVMEAMAAALPVISTSVGGVPELVEDGVTGLLVPPGNSEPLTAAMARLVEDSVLRRRMAKSASVVAGERWDVSVMARAYEQLYGRMLERRRASA